MTNYGIGVERVRTSRPADPALVVSVILLAGFGLAGLYTASAGFADRFFADSTYFIKRQLAFGVVGLLAAVVAASVDLEFLRRLVKPLVLVTFLLCLSTFIPGLGVVRNGSVRWIGLGGYTFQPSELAKLVLAIYLSHLFSKKEDRLDDASASVLPPAIVSGLFCLVVYLQRDFSTAAFLAFETMAIFFLAGVRFRHFAAIALVALPVTALLIFTEEYRVRRLMSFLRPEMDPLGAGYQVRASIETIASGGFWGKGLGEGTRKLASVPEIHSDFVFSAIAEEAGFVGVALLFALFVLFAARSFRTARLADDSFRRLLAAALAVMISGQVLLNLAVVSGVMPATGIPLPFFSAGGSSYVISLIASGLLINISRKSSAPGGDHV